MSFITEKRPIKELSFDRTKKGQFSITVGLNHVTKIEPHYYGADLGFRIYEEDAKQHVLVLKNLVNQVVRY